MFLDPNAPAPSHANLTSDLHALLIEANKLSKGAASNFPYYRERHGKFAKHVINLALKGAPVYVNFGRARPQTVRQQWYQGFRWLVDNDKEYTKHKYTIKCVTDFMHNRLIIDYKPERDSINLVTTTVWRADLIKFLDEAEPGQVLIETSTLFNVSDIAWVTNLLTPLHPLFSFDMSTTHLTVTREFDES